MKAGVFVLLTVVSQNGSWYVVGNLTLWKEKRGGEKEKGKEGVPTSLFC